MARRPRISGYPDPRVQLTRAAADLRGRRWIVVGGTDGLGRAIARAAAARGAGVLVVGRTFRDEGAPGLTFTRADLASMAAADALGASLPVEGVDVVVLTTGIFAPRERQLTPEGLEIDMAISALSRAAIARRLMPRLKADGAARPRVFIMGFPGAGNLGDPDDLDGARSYGQTAQHMNTVALNEALVVDLARRWPGVGVYGLNPGLIPTNIRANVFGEGTWLQRAAERALGWFNPTAEGYAEAILPTLTAPELDAHTGVHFNQRGAPILGSDGMDDARVARFIAAADAAIRQALAPPPDAG